MRSKHFHFSKSDFLIDFKVIFCENRISLLDRSQCCFFPSRWMGRDMLRVFTCFVLLENWFHIGDGQPRNLRGECFRLPSKTGTIQNVQQYYRIVLSLSCCTLLLRRVQSTIHTMPDSYARIAFANNLRYWLRMVWRECLKDIFS